LISWLREHGEDLELEDYDIADRLGGTIWDYRFPAYIVESDDEHLLRDVFDRVNSAGKPISRAQVFHALFGGSTEEVSVDSIVEQLRRHGFGSINENRVVQSLLAIRGGNISRDLHTEFSNGEDLADWYDRTEDALTRVIEFLKNQGVPHIQLVPSTFPIPVLAAYLYLHQDLSPWYEQLLSRCCGVAGHTVSAVKAVKPPCSDGLSVR
jgi:hypothetical protein